jgi:hypothetical protein
MHYAWHVTFRVDGELEAAFAEVAAAQDRTLHNFCAY